MFLNEYKFKFRLRETNFPNFLAKIILVAYASFWTKKLFLRSSFYKWKIVFYDLHWSPPFCCWGGKWLWVSRSKHTKSYLAWSVFKDYASYTTMCSTKFARKLLFGCSKPICENSFYVLEEIFYQKQFRFSKQNSYSELELQFSNNWEFSRHLIIA